MAARKRQIEVPLQLLPANEIRFHKIGIDVVSPLGCIKTDVKWILVISGFATRYPEAIPLRSTHSQKIADELIKFFHQGYLQRF